MIASSMYESRYGSRSLSSVSRIMKVSNKIKDDKINVYRAKERGRERGTATYYFFFLSQSSSLPDSFSYQHTFVRSNLARGEIAHDVILLFFG